MGLRDAIGFRRKGEAKASSHPRPSAPAPARHAAPPWAPRIDPESCRGCGSCLDACPEGVFSMGRHDKHARVARPGDCVATCDACARACPEKGITFPGRPAQRG